MADTSWSNQENRVPVRWISTSEFILIIWKEAMTLCREGGQLQDALEQFLLQSDQTDQEQRLLTELFARGRRKGWLEEEDEAFCERLIERRRAARIVHEFLRRECLEEDCADWSEARKLKDLFDCRVCVGHVAQVYVKGIMGASGEVFGMREPMEFGEAVRIARKMFRLKQRDCFSGESVGEWDFCGIWAKGVTKASLPDLLEKNQTAKLIDVRSVKDREAEEPISKKMQKDAIKLSMTQILENPECVGVPKDTCLILFCNRGYQSKIAANCLVEAGYDNVFYLENGERNT